jgi:hypothetical protein
MATKTKINTDSLSNRLDKIINKISDLGYDLTGGDITPNQAYDRLDKICEDIEKLRDAL